MVFLPRFSAELGKRRVIAVWRFTFLKNGNFAPSREGCMSTVKLLIVLVNVDHHGWYFVS